MSEKSKTREVLGLGIRAIALVAIAGIAIAAGAWAFEKTSGALAAAST